MQDPEKLREIDGLGEDGDAQEELWPEELEESSGWGGALLLQAVVCALVMLALVFFKLTDEGRFQEIAQWYGQEMSQEIELPKLRASAPEAAPSPTPEPSIAPTEAPSTMQPDGAPL